MNARVVTSPVKTAIKHLGFVKTALLDTGSKRKMGVARSARMELIRQEALVSAKT